jgi:hypothetical protein
LFCLYVVIHSYVINTLYIFRFILSINILYSVISQNNCTDTFYMCPVEALVRHIFQTNCNLAKKKPTLQRSRFLYPWHMCKTQHKIMFSITSKQLFYLLTIILVISSNTRCRCLRMNSSPASTSLSSNAFIMLE